MSESLRNAALEPPRQAYIVVCDYGPEGGGWGPMAIDVLGFQGVAVYTGTDTTAINSFYLLAESAVEGGAVKAAKVLLFESARVMASYGEERR